MIGQQLAGFGAAVDDVDHSVEQSGFLDRFHQRAECERGIGRRLEHHRATRG